MDSKNWKVQDTSLILSHGQARLSARQQYRVTEFFKAHGRNCLPDIEERLKRLTEYHLNTCSFLNYTKINAYTGMVVSQVTFQRDGGKTIALNVVLDIWQNPSNSNLYHKARITVSNTSVKTLDKLLILSVLDESITAEDSPLIVMSLAIADGWFSKKPTQLSLL